MGSLWFVGQSVGVGQEGVHPQHCPPTLCIRRRAGQGALWFSGGLCRPKSILGKEGDWPVSTLPTGEDELLLRKEPALQLCVHTGRGEELCWQ